MKPLIARVLAAGFAILVVSSCQAIVGIDDHVYQSPASPQCEQYCDLVLRNCTGASAVYSGRDTCLGVCGKLDPGDPLEPTDANTVACRVHQADLAGSTDEPMDHCPNAGPGGGGVCGTNCASYCQLFKATCPADSAELANDCEQACSVLRDTQAFDVVANHQGDTLQCRLVHVSSATVSADHCPHAQFHPSPPWCQEDQMAMPNCTEFCRLNMAACQGPLAAYESMDQCMAVCTHFPLGTNGDRTQNTMGCRVWHSYNSALAPDPHCSHTAAGGDGHCGIDQPDKTGNCESYCLLLQSTCPVQFVAAYPDQGTCQKTCSNMPDAFGAKHDSKYTLAAAQTGDTLQCRLLHVSRAITDPAECTSAAGIPGSACQ